MPPSRTAERLRRLLAVVPHVVGKPGTTLSDLSALFETSEQELLADLNLLFLTGLPPYGPGDLIEVDVDDDGRVWIRMADYFSRPVRLTRSEALALYLRGTEVLAASGPEEAQALRSALDKIAATLGPEALGDLQVEVGDQAGPPGHLEVVRRAVGARERLEVDYYSATRDEVTTRRIDPEQVFSAIGNWYVVAWDHRSDEERLFRIDRVRDARGTGETFETRGLIGQGRELYSGSAEDLAVRLRLGPGARWVAEYYQVDQTREGEGALVVDLPTKDLAGVAKLVLRLRGEAEVLDPPELASRVRELADEALARYRKGPGRRG
ncbi:MAG: helix-turn-helix transcriptional regulator [Actinomycetota bacterium]